MLLRIQTSDRQLIEDLLSKDPNPSTGKIELSEDCYVEPLQEYQPVEGMVGTPEIIEFVVMASTNIALGVLASWLYDKMKRKEIKAEIEGVELPVSREEIEAIILVLRNKEKGTDDT